VEATFGAPRRAVFAISDNEIRRDYEKVLQPGGVIAGPLATV